MNTGILLIELLILTIAFSAEVIISIIKNPEAWVADYPPEIQAEYYKTHENKREKLIKETIVRNAVPVCVDGGFFISSFRANELLYVLVLGNGLSLLLIF